MALWESERKEMNGNVGGSKCRGAACSWRYQQLGNEFWFTCVPENGSSSWKWLVIALLLAFSWTIMFSCCPLCLLGLFNFLSFTFFWFFSLYSVPVAYRNPFRVHCIVPRGSRGPAPKPPAWSAQALLTPGPQPCPWHSAFPFCDPGISFSPSKQNLF